MAAKSNKKSASAAKPSTERLIDWFRQMTLIRRFEERAGQLYGMGLIGGFCHLYIGEEAVVIGVQTALEAGDSVITSYRDHGHMLACGMDPKNVMAELLGRRAGYSKGKGGSMHMFSKAKNFYGGHGIVAAQVPLGTGIAFTHRYRKDGHICVTYLGDGAVNQGQVAEAFNMAALWKLPIVYIIENNRYGMGTSVERASAQTDLFHRGAAYGIPGQRCDGMDVTAVHEAAQEAIAAARCGDGPRIIETLTYRYRGHSMSDPAKYRPEGELADMREHHDPIEYVRRRLMDEHGAGEAQLKDIDRGIRETIAAAAEFAQQCPEPEPDELWTDVLAEA